MIFKYVIYIIFIVVSSLLELDTHKDYLRGDNSSIVPTDTQKNTVYAAAQKYGVSTEQRHDTTR